MRTENVNGSCCSFEAPRVPSLGVADALLWKACTIAILGYAMEVSIAKMFASKFLYEIRPNQVTTRSTTIAFNSIMRLLDRDTKIVANCAYKARQIDDVHAAIAFCTCSADVRHCIVISLVPTYLLTTYICLIFCST